MTVIASATLPADIRIIGTKTSPQVLLTTPPTQFDGGPVVIEFTAEYLNHLPAANTQSNGIGFDLMIDGVRMERIAFAGTHSTNNDFWPIVIRDVLDTAPRTISAGEHTVGLAVWRWSPDQDGYLTAHPGYQPGWGMPMRLTVYGA
jgi:hypothetical protein